MEMVNISIIIVISTEGKETLSAFFHIESVLDDHKQEIVPTMEKDIPGLAVVRVSTSEDL